MWSGVYGRARRRVAAFARVVRVEAGREAERGAGAGVGRRARAASCFLVFSRIAPDGELGFGPSAQALSPARIATERSFSAGGKPHS